jgi:type IV pilus assembly protein PilY1
MNRAIFDRQDNATGNWTTWLAGILLASLLYAPASRATIELADIPLFFAAGVDPNVLFEMDDSGSMDWEILTRPYWHFCDYDPDAPNDTWGFVGDTCNDFQYDNGLWNSLRSSTGTATFYYLYDNDDAAFNQGCSSDSGVGMTMYDCTTVSGVPRPYYWDWRALSRDFNVLYYTPATTYEPWNGPCMQDESPCTDASFGSAKSDPREDKDGYNDITNLDGFIYEIWTDDKGFDAADGRPLRGGDLNITDTPNKVVDLWDTHKRYTISGSDIIVDSISYAPDSSGMNPTTTSKTLSGATCHPELGGGGVACRTVAQTKQNVANWYQYSRKRAFVAKNALSRVISTTPGMRFGLDVINATIPIIEVPTGTGNFSSHNTDLLATFYDMDWPGARTPLRQGLERAGDYFDDTLGLDDPIEYSCQQNFTILVTDGYWNEDAPAVGNSDGDPYTNTVADVAHYYFHKDLSPLPDNVPIVPPLAGAPADLNDFQHMVTFTVAFGVVGALVDTDGDFWPNPPLTETSDWGDPDPANAPADGEIPEKIDDLWHAAYNSRGTFLSARTPGALAAGLKAALLNIEERRASTSTVALNTGFFNANSKVYQARFDSTDWHGELLSIPVIKDLNGKVTLDKASEIDARNVLPLATNRVILTNDGTGGVPVPFRWASLSVAQKAALNQDSVGNPDTLGDERTDYLRGDATLEGNPFRARTNGKLGDFVNSAPVFRGAPIERYPDNWGVGAPESCLTCKYSDFRNTYLNRTPMVFIGGNDGMVHGFDADTMVEKIAYVPTVVFDNLSALTDPNYNHQFYVDGTPTAIDAFFSSSWHTVLAGGLNKGGQLIYALDVTNPATFAETLAAAANIVLWEFTDADDADLGYTYSKPAVVRMHNGRWVVIFGNGYNSTENDSNVGSGHAVLYIVDLETGNLIRKIDTGVGTDNGLATVAPVDINGDFMPEYIYGGDLEGNMWKFNVSSNVAADWDVAFKAGGTNLPLFVAKDASNNRQPITVQPDAGRGPNGLDVMLYFGTGKYLGNADITDTSDQTFYGIIDNGTVVPDRNSLDAQTVTFQNNTARITSKNTLSANSRGWYLDLPETGERVASQAILRSGRIIFVTITPGTDVCEAGGSSWLMELNALNGALLDSPPFDNTDDGLFTIDDYIDTDGDGDGDEVQAGIRFEAIIPAPGILPDETTEYKFTPDSGGDLDITVENPGAGNVGRQSWGQLR